MSTSAALLKTTYSTSVGMGRRPPASPAASPAREPRLRSRCLPAVCGDPDDVHISQACHQAPSVASFTIRAVRLRSTRTAEETGDMR